VVPTKAIQTGQQGQYVFVVKPDQSVEQRPITVGVAINNETVIAIGVKVAETVVTDGQIRLVPGAKVEAKSETSKVSSLAEGLRSPVMNPGPGNITTAAKAAPAKKFPSGNCNTLMFI